MCIDELLQSTLTEHGPIQACFTSCVHVIQDIGLCCGVRLHTLSSGLYMHFSSPHIGVLSPEVANYHLKGLTDNCLKRQVFVNAHTNLAALMHSATSFQCVPCVL
jgi:hypothetical protein